jgi:hypothetical protein
LITSAGAMTRHEAISATAEADEWMSGSGSGNVLEKRSFVFSYVEKNRPAVRIGRYQY